MATIPFEKKATIQDESGYRLQLEEISFNQIDLKWGSYSTPAKKVLSFHPDKETIVSHFRMAEPSGAVNGRRQAISARQFIVYRQPASLYELCVEPTYDEKRSFFELALSEQFFNNLVSEESRFLTRFRDYSSDDTPAFDFMAPMAPAMQGVIRDMHYAPYNGYLKGVFLEAKAIELFLLQVQQLDQGSRAKSSTLKPGDIERLHAIRDYITTHYDESFSIVDLARKAGVNQMKLKNGFKELFDTTVFGYLADIRMQEAKRLLLEEKMYVNEVADRVGYKHPHHFAAAFKRKFGLMPKEYRR